jgi:hypothetical protein
MMQMSLEIWVQPTWADHQFEPYRLAPPSPASTKGAQAIGWVSLSVVPSIIASIERRSAS